MSIKRTDTEDRTTKSKPACVACGTTTKNLSNCIDCQTILC